MCVFGLFWTRPVGRVHRGRCGVLFLGFYLIGVWVRGGILFLFVLSVFFCECYWGKIVKGYYIFFWRIQFCVVCVEDDVLGMVCGGRVIDGQGFGVCAGLVWACMLVCRPVCVMFL